MSRIGPVLVGERDALGSGPQVHAMLIQNTNPAAVAPESAKVRAGLLRDDLFVCVHEQFMTDTAKLADIVLPATMMIEHDDLYTAGGQMHLQIGAKQIDPPGECRENHAVICGLAKRLGADHPGFDLTAWELVDATLKASGWPGADELSEARWHDCIAGTDTHFENGFGTPDGRFHFKPDWSGVGPNYSDMPALPDHFNVIEEATAEHPFRMIAPPARQFLNSSFTEVATSRAREGRPTALIHPKDCASTRPDRWGACSDRKPARHRAGPCEAFRRASAGRGGGRGHLAERPLYRGDRHQRPDRRRSRSAFRRSRLP